MKNQWIINEESMNNQWRINEESIENSKIINKINHLCYVIYTSG
jgi:hypothetical protein